MSVRGLVVTPHEIDQDQDQDLYTKYFPTFLKHFMKSETSIIL